MKYLENNLLFEKLNRFINKYYKNKILKGLIFLFAFFINFSVVFLYNRVFFQIQHNWKEYSFLEIYFSLNLIILIKFIVVPLSQLFRISKTIEYFDVAKIIGKHFSRN